MTLRAISDLPILPLNQITNQTPVPDDILLLIFRRFVGGEPAMSLVCRQWNRAVSSCRFTLYSQSLNFLSAAPRHFFFSAPGRRLIHIALAGEPVRYASPDPTPDTLIWSRRLNEKTVITVSTQGVITYWEIETDALVPRRSYASDLETKRVVLVEEHVLHLIPKQAFLPPKRFNLTAESFESDSSLTSLPTLNKNRVYFRPQEESIPWEGKSHPLEVKYPYAVDYNTFEKQIVVHSTSKKETNFPCDTLEEPRAWIFSGLLAVWTNDKQELDIWDISKENKLKTLKIRPKTELCDLYFEPELRQLNILVKNLEKTRSFALRRIFL